MGIEDRIAELEQMVQRLHEIQGHKWFRRTNMCAYLEAKPWKDCVCGATEFVADAEEYDRVPKREELVSEW